MDIVQTPQDKSRLPSEAAGYTLADSRTLPTDAERQSYIPRLELLVYLQTVETDDKGMWHNQVNIISLQSSWLRATLALSKGMPIESVSRVLGHTNIVTTQLYAKITTQKLDNDLTMFGDKLSKTFNGITMS